MAIRRSFLKSSRWFGDALSFACVQCGKCCQGPTNVFINSAEADAISKLVGMTKFDFMKKYTEERDTIAGLQTSLVSNVRFHQTQQSAGPTPKKEHCVFLDGKKCSIYSARPTRCRTYPFWPQAIVGKAEWIAESQKCEGIQIEGLDPTITTTSNGTKINRVDHEVVAHNLIINEVHSRGIGQNWTYDESVEYLKEANRTSGTDMVADFENDFFSSHSSKIVMENSNLRIVDTTSMQVIAKAPEEGAQMSSATALAKDDASDPEFETKAMTFRRLEFMNTLGITQSEVKLSEDGTCDHEQITLFVHQAMSAIVSRAWFASQSPLVGSSARRALVVGAGGCVLPMHLLIEASRRSKINGSTSQYLIDAVEPSADILLAAETYFGAAFVKNDSEHLPGYRNWREYVNSAPQFQVTTKGKLELEGLLVPILSTGEDYLESLPKERQFEVIIMDAFEEINRDGGLAPPTSLMTERILGNLVNHLVDGGCAVFNIMGDEEWIQSSYSRVLAACRARNADSNSNVTQLVGGTVALCTLFDKEVSNRLIVVNIAKQGTKATDAASTRHLEGIANVVRAEMF